MIQYQERDYQTDSKLKEYFFKRCDTNIRLLQQQLLDIESKYKSIKNKNFKFNCIDSWRDHL